MNRFRNCFRLAGLLTLMWVFGVAAPARAQTNDAIDAVAAYVIGPPTVAALICDVAILSSLSNTGTAGRGLTITAVSFAAVDTFLSLLLLAVGMSDSRTRAHAIPLFASSLGVATGSLALAVYGIGHAPTEPTDERPPGELPPLSAPSTSGSIPQLHQGPAFRLVPLIQLDGRGILGGGALFLRF